MDPLGYWIDCHKANYPSQYNWGPTHIWLEWISLGHSPTQVPGKVSVSRNREDLWISLAQEKLQTFSPAVNNDQFYKANKGCFLSLFLTSKSCVANGKIEKQRAYLCAFLLEPAVTSYQSPWECGHDTGKATKATWPATTKLQAWAGKD